MVDEIQGGILQRLRFIILLGHSKPPFAATVIILRVFSEFPLPKKRIEMETEIKLCVNELNKMGLFFTT